MALTPRRVHSERLCRVPEAAPGLGRGEVWLEVFAQEGRADCRPQVEGLAFWVSVGWAAADSDIQWPSEEFRTRPSALEIEPLRAEIFAFLSSHSPRVLLALAHLLDSATSLEDDLERELEIFPGFFEAPDLKVGISAFRARTRADFLTLSGLESGMAFPSSPSSVES